MRWYRNLISVIDKDLITSTQKDLFLFQRSFTVITFIYYPRQESSSNHISINFSFVRTLDYG